jgi:hypothetical protein
MLSRWSHRFSIALELNELSKEGTFRFRPALMNNAAEAFKCCASSAHCQFFSLDFAATLSPGASEGAAVRTPLPIPKRNCRKHEPLQGSSPGSGSF